LHKERDRRDRQREEHKKDFYPSRLKVSTSPSYDRKMIHKPSSYLSDIKNMSIF